MKSERLVIFIFAVFAVLGSMLSVVPVKAALDPIDVYAGNPGYWIDQSGTHVSALNTPIQDAVDSVGAGLGYVTLILVHPDPGGVYTYHEYVTIDDTKSGLTLRGDGAGVTILDGTGLPIPYPSPSGIRIVKADDVTIEGFTITHYAYWTAFGYGIEIDGAEPDYATNNIIRNNIIESCGSGIGMGVASSNTIENNIIRNSNYWWGGGLGVFIDNGYGNQIKDNEIYNTGLTGIELHIAGHTQVLTNFVYDNGWFGLYADGYSGYLTIYGNTFNHNGLDGATDPWGFLGSGIFLISGANDITLNTANKNHGMGIRIAQGGGNALYNNKAINNDDYGIGIFSDYNTIGDPNTPSMRNTAKVNKGLPWPSGVPQWDSRNWYDYLLHTTGTSNNNWAPNNNF